MPITLKIEEYWSFLENKQFAVLDLLIDNGFDVNSHKVAAYRQFGDAAAMEYLLSKNYKLTNDCLFQNNKVADVILDYLEKDPSKFDPLCVNDKGQTILFRWDIIKCIDKYIDIFSKYFAALGRDFIKEFNAITDCDGLYWYFHLDYSDALKYFKMSAPDISKITNNCVNCLFRYYLPILELLIEQGLDINNYTVKHGRTESQVKFLIKNKYKKTLTYAMNYCVSISQNLNIIIKEHAILEDITNLYDNDQKSIMWYISPDVLDILKKDHPKEFEELLYITDKRGKFWWESYVENKSFITKYNIKLDQKGKDGNGKVRLSYVEKNADIEHIYEVLDIERVTVQYYKAENAKLQLENRKMKDEVALLQEKIKLIDEICK
jgi:hypothetical protein